MVYIEGGKKWFCLPGNPPSSASNKIVFEEET